MANKKATIKVGIQLDEEEYKELLAGIHNFETEIGRAAREARIASDLAKAAASAPIGGREETFSIADEQLNKMLEMAREAGHEQEFMFNLITKGEKEATAELNKFLGIQVASNNLTKEQIRLIQFRATELRHESVAIRRSAADLQLFANTALVTGTGAIASMVLMADQFAKVNAEGDAQAGKYRAQMDRLKRQQAEIGRSFSVALMPFMQEAINLLHQVSSFLEAHPELATAAIKGAEILIGVGAIGKSVATAARLTADFLAIQGSILRLIATRAEEALTAEKQLAAAEAQNIAADKQLTAAEVQNTANVGGVTAKGLGGTLLNFAQSPAGIATLITANVAVATKISKQLDQVQPFLNNLLPGLGDVFRTGINSFFQVIPGGTILTGVEQLKYIARGVEGIFNRITKNAEEERSGRTATTPAGRTDITKVQPGSVALSKNLDQLLKAYEDYVNDDLKLVTDHYAKRQDIIDDAYKAERDENRRYAKAVADINEDLGKKLTKLTRDYNDQVEEAERKHAEARAKVVEGASEDIQRIEEDLRNKLAKLAKDHAERQSEILAARDALALVKEQRKYQDSLDEARNEANQEIARRREDIAKRLAEIDREYAEEKVRRLQDYQDRVKEAREQAAERLAEQAERHKEELDQIREQAAERLAEEQRNFEQERIRNRQQFIQRIRDIDAFYLGEINLRRQRQSEMIADLDAFLIAYRTKTQAMFTEITKAATATGGTVGHRAGGGYVGSGTYQVGEGGKEFVLNNQTTRAAEQAIGGQLNQANLMAALRNSGGTTIVWEDRRTFDSNLSPQQRREIVDDSRKMILEMFKQ